MTTILAALREGTAKQHRRLHEHVFMKELEVEGFRQPQYGLLLSAFWSPWARLERSMNHPPGTLHWSSGVPPRTADIEADLHDMDMPVPPTPKERLSPGKALGYAYALVGSSMGAPTLRKAVLRSVPSAPTRYLSLSPTRSGWPHLRNYLTTADASLGTSVCEGAREAFSAIEVALDSWEGSPAGVLML